MSIPADTIERGVAACFPQPVNEDDMEEARRLVEDIHYINCVHSTGPLLPQIVYRSSFANYDIRHHVFRWDPRVYTEVFVNGFRATPQGDTPDYAYYNLQDHVNRGRPPARPDLPTTPRVFVSTTLAPQGSVPFTNPVGSIVYRYEIYAPGGILAQETLRERNNFPGQQEVAFPRGIARQYIRAAQPFIITGYDDHGHARVERVDITIAENRYFDPQPDEQIDIVRPCLTYRDEYNRNSNLQVEVYPPHHGQEMRKKRQAYIEPSNETRVRWYASGVANCESYIDAAFRSSITNEAYLFMKNEYVRMNYAPHSTGDEVLNGPLLICDGFPSLMNTTFGEYGIDCAFGTHYRGHKAFIFAGNLCAVVDYAPGTTDDQITNGPKTISDMFPFFKGTAFESGIDAAFEATSNYEAYLFKGREYALINYDSPECYAIRPIVNGFASLENTIFEDGIDAAFASHKKDEAYIFKGSMYALINFAPGTTDDYIIDGAAKEIKPNWPSLANILPRKNAGLDMHAHGYRG